MKTNISRSADVTHSTIGKNCFIGDNTRFCYSTLGDYSYISVNSNIFSTHIGKYCSLSWNVTINPANHDYHRITQHSMLFASKFGMIESGENAFYKQYGANQIGNDVCIGCNALIMGNVHIGDGAVIGANSRITKNVEPYSIVVGNDRVIRKRFTDEIITELLELQWWNYPPLLIKKHIDILAKIGTHTNVIELKEALNSSMNNAI